MTLYCVILRGISTILSIQEPKHIVQFSFSISYIFLLLRKMPAEIVGKVNYVEVIADFSKMAAMIANST